MPSDWSLVKCLSPKMPEIVTRQYAIANGLGKYFTGKPCRKGHIAERWVAGACAQCVSERKKDLYKENREQVLAYMKIQGKKYREHNKDACLKRSYAWRDKNKEKVYAQAKQRREENPENDRAKSRRHYYKNRETELLRQKLWRGKNKGLVNYYTGQRKAARLQRTPAWLTEFDKLKIECYYSIAAMLTRVNNEQWEVDHVLPLRGKTVSGLHVPNNLQVLRKIENMRKGNRA